MDLRKRFTKEPLFSEVIEAIYDLDRERSDRERRRARHRAVGYQIDNGKLWRITNGRSIRARARVECISQTEAIELAKLEHGNNGHWGRDLVKLKMLDKIWSPRLDQSIVNAILQCPQCKNFGSSHLHSLMYPITRRHPFELLVADYLSLPKGKGGFHNVLLIMDTFSQYVWGFKLKVHGTAKTTIDGMKTIAHTFRAPETLMTDGGSHFKNGDVRAWCEANEVKHQIVAAYAPWVNGLVENANGKLLGRLKRLCSPGLGEDEYQEVKPDDIGKAWPDHFDTTIRQLNERIIPAFQFSPKELLLGIVVLVPIARCLLISIARFPIPPSTVTLGLIIPRVTLVLEGSSQGSLSGFTSCIVPSSLEESEHFHVPLCLLEFLDSCGRTRMWVLVPRIRVHATATFFATCFSILLCILHFAGSLNHFVETTVFRRYSVYPEYLLTYLVQKSVEKPSLEGVLVGSLHHACGLPF
jgi:transposase InsO family protein